MYCSMSMKKNTLCVVGKNPKTSKLSPMADDTITGVGIGSLVSLVYICGEDYKPYKAHLKLEISLHEKL